MACSLSDGGIVSRGDAHSSPVTGNRLFNFVCHEMKIFSWKFRWSTCINLNLILLWFHFLPLCSFVTNLSSRDSVICLILNCKMCHLCVSSNAVFFYLYYFFFLYSRFFAPITRNNEIFLGVFYATEDRWIRITQNGPTFRGSSWRWRMRVHTHGKVHEARKVNWPNV